MTELSKAQSTPYHRGHHRFAVLTASSVFLLIVAGALVTSNEAGLSVPDWPTSFGSLYRIPPLIGGVKFEHVHRMLAELIGLLTIGLAVWTQKVDKRRWMRILAWSALGTVIAQGILGGLTVLFYLPPAISTAHATLGQTFFCIMVSMAFFTSKSWVQAPVAVVHPDARPRLTTLSLLTVAAVWLQLILGAAFRHSGIRLLPHVIGAGVVFCLVNWLAISTLKRHRGTPQLATPAAVLLVLLAGADHTRGGQLHHPCYLEPDGLGAAGKHGSRDRGPRCLWCSGTDYDGDPGDPDSPVLAARVCPRSGSSGSPPLGFNGARMTTAPTQPLVIAARGPFELLRDYAELTKIRVTALVVVTAWSGFFFGQHKSGLPVLTLKLLWALAGIGMVAAGTACMNEIIERKSDALMRRTALRPLVTRSLSLGHAIIVWAVLTATGAALLALKLNASHLPTQPIDRWLLSADVHTAEEDQPAVYVRRSLSRCDARSAGLDRRARASGIRSPRAVCHCFLLAVPALPLHRSALPRRLRQGGNPHVARG